MAQDFTVSVVAGQNLQRQLALAGADARAKIRKEINSAMLLFSSTEKTALSQNFTRRTGLLENVIIEPVTETAANMTGRVGTPAIYGRIHELGGTIRAKNVANLTIPLSAIKTQRGVARGTARDVKSNPGSYGFDSAFFATSKAGNTLLFGKKKSGQVSPLFLLKPEVTLPARPTWKPSLDHVEPIFRANVTTALKSLIQA